MKRLAGLLGLLFVFNTSATDVVWLEAKESMECSVDDATVSHLSNYLIKEKFTSAVDEIFKTLGIKYLRNSLVISETVNDATATEKNFFIGGSLMTSKGSLIKLTDKRYSDEESTLAVKLSVKEVEKYEYDSEGIPTLRTWTCTVTTSSGDLGIRFINQSQNDYSIGSMKVKLAEIYKFEKVEKL